MKLSGVLFNHDKFSSRNSALNVRLNAVSAARLPEWEPGDTFFSSVACYSAADVDLDDLRVFARFRAPEHANKTVLVLADTPDSFNLPAFLEDQLNALVFLNYPLYLAVRQYLQIVATFANETNSNVLGALAPTAVTFDGNGNSDWMAFKPTGAKLKTLGIGRHVLTWHWASQTPGETLRPFQVTQHKIYTVLKTPERPWVQQPFTANNTQLPWIEALEVATQWAAGATDIGDACQRITHAVYDLGGEFFQYGCPIGAVTVYSEFNLSPLFNLTMFLQRLGGGRGLGQYVNCSDCATFVSTFANLVGAALWQSQMRDFERAFPVNPILAIGDTLVLPPCGVGLFNYHEVAWSGEATEDDLVYDACLEVNSNTALGPVELLLPTGLRFGSVNDGQYRDCLAAPFGRDLCKAQPTLRVRRAVF
ncbi:hypothetical protein NKJ10_28315 [Mesorhizobium sp. M0204]|uniref:hypothetical protein n=1 Tax=Mesorhizobium sp. M0204 TaxID=2956913 RepID=UPI003335813C